MHMQLVIDLPHVEPDRVQAQRQPVRATLITVTFREQLQHLARASGGRPLYTQEVIYKGMPAAGAIMPLPAAGPSSAPPPFGYVTKQGSMLPLRRK